MTQDDMPAPAVVETPAVVGAEKAVNEDEKAVIEYETPSSAGQTTPNPAKTAKLTASRSSSAPDAYAVGVRVLKLAPAWLLFTAVCCSVLVLMLGWVRSSTTEAEVLPARRNDARAANPAPEADPTAAKTETGAPVNASLATTSGPKTTAANDAPAVAQVTTPAPQPEPAAAPKVDEKARVETPAPAAEEGGNFTAQVGSHTDQSEANEQVSRLRAAGFDARSVTAALPGRGVWYRVQVGRFAERGEAAKTVATLRAKGAAAAALVVPVQK